MGGEEGTEDGRRPRDGGSAPSLPWPPRRRCRIFDNL